MTRDRQLKLLGVFTFFYKAGIALQDDALLPTAQHGACIAAVPPLRDCSTTPLDKPRQLLSRFPVTTMLSIHCSTVSPPHLAVAVLPHHTDSRTRSSAKARRRRRRRRQQWRRRHSVLSSPCPLLPFSHWTSASACRVCSCSLSTRGSFDQRTQQHNVSFAGTRRESIAVIAL